MIFTPVQAASDAPMSYVQIKYVGAVDKPIVTVIVTMDPTVATSFRDDLWCRVHVLSPESFARVSSFFASKIKEGNWSASSPGVVYDFGSFELSDRTRVGDVKSYCVVVPRKDSLGFLRSIAGYLSAKKIDGGLLKDINVLILRVKPDSSE